jgi:hypothetical protein
MPVIRYVFTMASCNRNRRRTPFNASAHSLPSAADHSASTDRPLLNLRRVSCAIEVGKYRLMVGPAELSGLTDGVYDGEEMPWKLQL